MGSHFKLRDRACEAAAAAARTVKRGAASSPNVKRMDLTPLLEHIERNLAGDLSLAALAQRGGFSPYHFHRLFHAEVGEPPKQYVRRLRLERAATRLKLSRRSVTDIAFDAGYATHEAFTRAFGDRFGVAPRSFRAALPERQLPPGFAPRIERVAARRVAFLRHVGPYDQTAETFEQLTTWAQRRGLRRETMLALYWDDQDITAAEQTRCEVALVVDASVEGDREVRVRVLCGGDHAVFEQTGEVPERRSFYEAAFRTWLPSIGRRPANAPPFEEYAATAAGADQSSARIHIPLRPR